MLVRAPVLNAVGGFNPAFKYADDYDWLLRTRDAGFSGDELATPLAEYRVHGMNQTKRVGRKPALFICRIPSAQNVENSP